MLHILNPLVQRQYEVAKKYQLIDGIKELVMGEEDTGFLSPEYREILKEAEVIKKNYHE